MNILVINGSPKGNNSITLHTCLYLEKKFPQHKFEVLHAGQKIRSLEKDFAPAVGKLREADLILFCYPVYTFLVPYQLHRFIELMKESGEDFSGKVATQVTTSKHFYDITAHRFVADNCADMGIRCMEGLSADMEDLLKEQGRRQAEDWFDFTLWKMTDLAALPAAEKKADRRAVIVADLVPGDDRLKGMIDRFVAVFPYECDVVNIEDFPFQGGCISCFSCAATGMCAYKDGFDEYLRNTIHKHDAIVYAFRIKDHSMGSRFKMYDDRQFCNGHRTVTMGKPVGYLIDGDLSREENLRMLLEARSQVGGNFLAGTADNESDPDAAVDRMAAVLTYALVRKYGEPANFFGVGGMKIFRDLIWQMQGLMREDHRFYKKHGFYDFPQKRKGRVAGMYLVGAMMTNPSLRKKMGGRMTEGMMLPYKKVLEKAKKEAEKREE